MSIFYVKGSGVANATRYDLKEKLSDGTYNTLVEDASGINFEVSALGLADGDHTLVVVAQADDYADSDPSNEVVFTVGEGGSSGSGGNTGGTTPTTPEVRYKGAIASGGWSTANVASCYEICEINAGEILSSIVNSAGTSGVTPKLMLLDSNNKVVYTKTMSTNTGSDVTTEINYQANEDLTLWIGGVSGSMGYRTGATAGSSGDMNYVDFAEVGSVVTPTISSTKIAFNLTVNVLV